MSHHIQEIEEAISEFADRLYGDEEEDDAYYGSYYHDPELQDTLYYDGYDDDEENQDYLPEEESQAADDESKETEPLAQTTQHMPASSQSVSLADLISMGKQGKKTKKPVRKRKKSPNAANQFKQYGQQKTSSSTGVIHLSKQQEIKHFGREINAIQSSIKKKVPLKEAVDSQLPVKKSMHLFPKQLDKEIAVVLMQPNPKWVKRYRQLQMTHYKPWCDQFTVIQEEEQYIKSEWNENPQPLTRFREIKGSFQRVTNRSHYASCVVGHHILIHGGLHHKRPSSDFIDFDTKKMTIKIYEKLEEFVSFDQAYLLDQYKLALSLPSTSHHDMVPFGSQGVLIFGGGTNHEAHTRRVPYLHHANNPVDEQEGMHLYYISNPCNPQKIHLGFRIAWNGRSRAYDSHPVGHLGTVEIPKLQEFTVTPIASCEVYLFGGRSHQSPTGTNTLYYMQNRSRSPHGGFAVEIHDESSAPLWPCKRYAHSACLAGNSIYIFGGKSGNTLLNDLWRFDVAQSIFSEVLVEGVTPSPTAYSIACFNSPDIILCGGVNSNDNPTRLMNRYSVETGLYHTMLLEDSTIFDVDCTAAHVVNRDIFLLGRMNTREKTLKSRGVCTQILHFADRGELFPLVNHLRSIFNSKAEKSLADVTFVLPSGDVTVEIVGHQAIIAVRCSFLRVIMEQYMEQSHNTLQSTFDVMHGCEKEHLTVDLTAIPSSATDEMQQELLKIPSGKVLRAYIRFLYTGEVNLEGKELIQELLKFVDDISSPHQTHIQKACSMEEGHLDEAVQILYQLKEDFQRLFTWTGSYEDVKTQESSTSHNVGAYSDVSVVLSDGSTVMAHKSMLSRISYFSNIFSSGMREEVEACIFLEDSPAHIMRMILEYAYTDSIKIDESTVLELWIEACKYNIREIVSVTRKFIGRCLTVDNCLQIVEIAHNFSDPVVLSEAQSFTSKHFEQLKVQIQLLDLPIALKTKISSGYTRKNRKSKMSKSCADSEYRFFPKVVTSFP